LKSFGSQDCFPKRSQNSLQKNPGSPKCSNCFPIFQKKIQNFQKKTDFPKDLFRISGKFQKIFQAQSHDRPRPSGPRCPPAKRPTSDAGQTGDIYGDIKLE
jgi:hypothetical protein